MPPIFNAHQLLPQHKVQHLIQQQLRSRPSFHAQGVQAHKRLQTARARVHLSTPTGSGSSTHTAYKSLFPDICPRSPAATPCSQGPITQETLDGPSQSPLVDHAPDPVPPPTGSGSSTHTQQTASTKQSVASPSPAAMLKALSQATDMQKSRRLQALDLPFAGIEFVCGFQPKVHRQLMMRLAVQQRAPAPVDHTPDPVPPPTGSGLSTHTAPRLPTFKNVPLPVAPVAKKRTSYIPLPKAITGD